MKSLKLFIFENELSEIKDTIKQKVDAISNIEFLKKIKKTVNLTDEEYISVKDIINNYFVEHCGLNEKIRTTIIQKIKHYGLFKEFGQLLSAIIDRLDSKYNYVTADKIINNDNIYKIINDFANSVDRDITNDTNFEKLIYDIANFDIAGKVGAGKMEYLSLIFLKDLNPKNTKGDKKQVCDINCKNIGLEYKLSGARISGNINDSRPLSAEVITKKCIELSKKYLKKQKDVPMDIYKNLDSLSDIFRSKNDIDNYLSIVSNYIDDKNINLIIVNSFLSQLPNLKLTSQDIALLYDICQPVSNGTISNLTQLNPSIQMIKEMWLIINLYNYYNFEQFDYIIIFDEKLNGNYKVLDFENISSLEDIYNTVKGKVICDALPSYTRGSNAQNSSPTIKYIRSK